MSMPEIACDRRHAHARDVGDGLGVPCEPDRRKEEESKPSNAPRLAIGPGDGASSATATPLC